jgi:hypothetical protein
LSDILLGIRTRLLDLDYEHDFEGYCRDHDLNINDLANKLEYKQQIKIAKELSIMFNEDELASLPTSSLLSDNLEGNLVELDNIFEYNKLCELRDSVKYYDKLLSQYGYDVEKGEWNRRDFPVTQTDKQMDGIFSDIEKADKAAEEYNEYLDYLCKKYDLDTNKMGKYRFIIPKREGRSRS